MPPEAQPESSHSHPIDASCDATHKDDAGEHGKHQKDCQREHSPKDTGKGQGEQPNNSAAAQREGTEHATKLPLTRQKPRRHGRVVDETPFFLDHREFPALPLLRRAPSADFGKSSLHHSRVPQIKLEAKKPILPPEVEYYEYSKRGKGFRRKEAKRFSEIGVRRNVPNFSERILKPAEPPPQNPWCRTPITTPMSATAVTTLIPDAQTNVLALPPFVIAATQSLQECRTDSGIETGPGGPPLRTVTNTSGAQSSQRSGVPNSRLIQSKTGS